MNTLQWQKAARYQLENLYQTDICPLDENEILAVVLQDHDRLEKYIDQEQIKLLENVKFLLIAKVEETESIDLAPNTMAVIFGKTCIESIHNEGDFAAWLNAQAPVANNHSLAFASEEVFSWEYEEECLLDNQKLFVDFKIKVNILPDRFMSIVSNWLRRQDIMHLCEINELFHTYLISVNFTSMLSTYQVEDLVDDSFVQQKLKKRLDVSMTFFEDYGLNVAIDSIQWRAEETLEKKESLTSKIEKGRKESPIDNMRYDQLQIKRIIDEVDSFVEQTPDEKIQRRTQRQNFVSQITATRRIKKRKP